VGQREAVCLVRLQMLQQQHTGERVGAVPGLTGTAYADNWESTSTTAAMGQLFVLTGWRQLQLSAGTIPHPVACTSVACGQDGALDTCQVALKVHGPLVEVAGGHSGHPAPHGGALEA
jgi:hypothetical protein